MIQFDAPVIAVGNTKNVSQPALVDEQRNSLSESAELLLRSGELENILAKRVAEYEANPEDIYSLDKVVETLWRDLGN
ncbi:MAG: hypothetical protein AB8B64_01745 [Granulosicoccus sp.]